MQVVTHGVALALGAVLGVLGAQAIEYARDPETLARAEGNLSRAELIRQLDAAEAKYAALLLETAKKDEAQRSELESATARVTSLETDVAKKADEVQVLELKVKKAKGQSAALKKELEAKQAELTELQEQLAEAQAEQQRLEGELTVSRSETQEAREETRVAQGETVDARWEGFRTTVVLTVCEKGNRKRMETCRGEIQAAMDSKRAARFKQCVGSWQAQPRLVRVDDKDKNPELPRWSEWLAEESKFAGQKWYLVFCDPSLPEARFGAEEEGEL
jgi:DNA repair exonuclease SbcCD ATPase subunit